MTTYRMDLAYDGTRYSGWQRLGGEEETLQGRIEEALSRLLETPTEIQGSGRTDAGVHARGQVASFHTAKPVNPERLWAQLNHYLPSDIAILGVRIAEERFHARYNAVRKEYRYRVWNARLQSPLERRFRHHVGEALDVAAMGRASAELTGSHDFSAFTTMKSKKKSAVRALERIDISVEGPRVDMCFVADGFLHNMVRILAGTLLEIGAGRMDAGAMAGLLESGDRSKAGPMAPPQGLVLWGVDYGEGLPGEPEGWEGLSQG